MHLSTLHRASLGRLDQGALPMLGRASLGRLCNTEARNTGGDDAPGVHIGESGAARRFIRKQFPEVYDSVEDAIKAIERAEKKPNKQQLRRARTALRAVKTEAADQTVQASLSGAAMASELLSIDELLKAKLQLRFILEQIEAFKLKDQREEDALLALLLAL